MTATAPLPGTGGLILAGLAGLAAMGGRQAAQEGPELRRAGAERTWTTASILLTDDPERTIRAVFAHLDEPFAHDFDDLALGTPDLHTVRRGVVWIEREPVLSPDAFGRFADDRFVPELNLRGVPVLLEA